MWNGLRKDTATTIKKVSPNKMFLAEAVSQCMSLTDVGHASYVF